MTQFHLTVNHDQLKNELLKSNLNTVVKLSIVLILNQIMELERDDFLHAATYQRDKDRIDYRMAIMSVTIQCPFYTSIFEKYRRFEKAFLFMLELVRNGVSIRKVTMAVEKLCGEKVSKL
ncbi:mobile element protein [Sporolactobacillus inulinus]|uniref:Mobile element protein n=1 Tax=Sporolactobacillus inulinus TaxID=2078 RepID=A0A4Y1ZHY9_9BACL|nr:transposase [Sporolactobacillus inulinus]GAY78745.1 mobile element protein [Sporolactobacillus inulinus]